MMFPTKYVLRYEVDHCANVLYPGM